ncbi:MAG: nucleotidyl transferase AbiEii/AbiGii toxin family protein [Coriobacteriia bacterium]|nr:nucleotidyl transferase AbiEii/AbiGii toxin family protein [Coriobacteriia bacterium]
MPESSPSSQDFLAFARLIAQDAGRGVMLPVIEKELLHFEIINALDEAGLLKHLTFQGGTCLRLCYGAERASEDLDFCGGFDFDPSLLQGLGERLKRAITCAYRVDVEIGEPKPVHLDSSGEYDADAILVHTWQIKVVTAQERPDIPKQRINIEIAAVPAHTKQIRALELRYPNLPPSFGDILVYCESLEEIAADKLKAFITASNIRYRDIWDLRWIARQPGFDKSQLDSLLAKKLADYHAHDVFHAKLPELLAALPDITKSAEFLLQMRRFLPAPVLERTIQQPEFQQHIVDEIIGLYRSAQVLEC